jgi:hypothetical protein
LIDQRSRSSRVTLAARVRKSEFYNLLRLIRLATVPIRVQGEEIFFLQVLLSY